MSIKGVDMNERSGRWLAKVKHYRGGESVLGYYEDLRIANERVADWNLRYQTDSAFVEAFDDAKSDWPTAARIRFENGRRR